MKRRIASKTMAACVWTLSTAATAVAAETDVNIPITANQAFDAVVQQVDPRTGAKARVALVDVRTTAEYFWVGACGKVERITTTSGQEFIPHNGKVVSQWGLFLAFEVEGPKGLRPVLLPVDKVGAVKTVDISVHVPTNLWDDANGTQRPNPDFAATIESLSANFDVLILMCRSGQRSNTRAFNTSLFAAIYEIDDPKGTDGHGGFQGASYHDVYNGYRGYPGRGTWMQETPSVSWSDARLPVHIGWTPSKPAPAAPPQ